MKGFRLSISLIITALLLVNCAGGGGPVAPGDYMPPVWDTTTGVTSVVPGENQVTVIWGTATDAQTPPVEYLVYIDQDDDPWDSIPEIKTTNDPHIFTNLINGTEYWCGVRCMDSVDPPNIDDNSVVISSTPDENLLGLDITPPVWDDAVGVMDVTSGEGSITVSWGTATDAESPSVEYLLYSDTYENLFHDPLVFTTNDPYTFTGLYSNIDYRFAVRCRDSAIIPNTDSNDNILVAQTIPKGWMIDWEGDQLKNTEIQIDSVGNIYILCNGDDDIDYDPGEDVSQIDWSYSSSSAVLLKLNSDGEYQWANQLMLASYTIAQYKYDFCIDSNDYIYLCLGRDSKYYFQKMDSEGNRIWEQQLAAPVNGMIVDENDNVYITGYFGGTVDFNPGDFVDIRSAQGYRDVYLIKFNPSGFFEWVATWGNNSWYPFSEIAADYIGNIYVVGEFEGYFDFDTGPGTDFHTSSDNGSPFLCSLTTGGAFRWARTWEGNMTMHSVTANRIGDIYLAGSFLDTVDFDSGAGHDFYSTDEGKWMGYLCRVDATGLYEYVYIGEQTINPAFNENGNMYCNGTFNYDVGFGDFDLDLTEGVDYFMGEQHDDAYLSLYDNEGSYLWSMVWGGFHGEVSTHDLAFDYQGNAYVLGTYIRDDCDFDPGPGVDIHESGYKTLYLSKFPPDGYW